MFAKPTLLNITTLAIAFFLTSIPTTPSNGETPTSQFILVALDKDDAPKKELTIKDIMIEAHKKGLVKKVAIGKASDKENKRLHELYKKLQKLKPPKGDQKSWDTKTKALVDAAKAAVEKKENFKAKLKAATNCAQCHKVHK